VCTDSKGCGTNSGKPIESIDCNCRESWSCGEWSSCTDGKQIRACKDSNQCSNDRTEIQFCFFQAPTLEVKGLFSGIEYVGKTINYIETNILPFAKKPVFYITLTITMTLIIAFIFRNNLSSASKSALRNAKRLKKYKLKINFKISKEK
jgi:hypothetical protein